uniref:Aspartyl aminopeptidase n=1 Tax=Strongyloides papillosus TaxID=174720 RepID=A0A0N5BT53_STREA
MLPEVKKAATNFITFLNKAVTPFHAVNECKLMLEKAGFKELKESEPWVIENLGKYYVTKNRSAIVAFAVGGKYESGNGFSIVVGHTDSPCLRVKPVSKLRTENYIQVGVHTYGGGIWRTWFDRDLCVAGEVTVKCESKGIVVKHINISKPVLFIPNLAIHLESDRNTFSCNNETNLRPIFATSQCEEMKNSSKCHDDKGTDGLEKIKDPRSVLGEHHDSFLKMIADEAGVTPEEIINLDLYLYDSNKACITGINEEFISGARLDNLVGTYTSVQALIDSINDSQYQNDKNVRMAACFDNEECGSQSAQGAQSAFIQWVLRRIAKEGFEVAMPRSFMISADQAHAYHPNYTSKYEENHRPAFHGGVVVKINPNQRYATTGVTHTVLKQVAFEAQVPLQKMCVRNDSPCGSTVGPILSAELGMMVVDVGCPQLAMHSIRELADTSSIYHATKLYSTFFNRCHSIINQLNE